MKLLFSLYLTYLKISFASFGGISMIPLLSREMLSHGWMTETEVGDIVAIAEMTPGPLALNCASFVDYSGSPEPVNPLFRATCSDWQSRSE